MSSFVTPLRLEFDYDGDPRKPFVLLEAFSYLIGDSDERWVTVPTGFRTDFASIPRPFRNVFNPTGRYGKAAVVHDGLYNDVYISELLIDEGTGDVYENHYHPTRKEADGIFLEAMKVLGVGWWTRTTVYLAVRTGGRGSFRKVRNGS
jgi:hypothetical protein